MFDLHRKNDDAALASIPLKANKLLRWLLIGLLLIVLRLWHLAVIQHEKKVDEAFFARRKTVVEPSERGTIRDRFNTVLAANTTEYRLSFVYSELLDVPTTAFEKMPSGIRKKRPIRKEYVKALSKLLSREVELDSDRTEDIIHSHAALYGSIPLVLKNTLTEKQYFRLKVLEKDWPGILLERIPKRNYPYARAGSHIIGYLGPMQKERYESFIGEMRTLSDCLKEVDFGLDAELPAGFSSFEEVKQKLVELQERAYRVNDQVGILGVESSFEETLRGYFGKKVYFSDARGNFVRSLPGSHAPFAGKRVLLSISIELQEYAERLLAESELDRQLASDKEKKNSAIAFKEPWMRGGSIVAIDPNTAEVIALASYPRFDPNDFVRAKGSPYENILRWMENEEYISMIWNQRLSLKRELIAKDGSWYEEDSPLTWKTFLEMTLPPGSPIDELLKETTSIEKLISLQIAFDQVLQRAPAGTPQEVMDLLYPPQLNKAQEKEIFLFSQDIAPYKKCLDSFLERLSNNRERLLLLDMTRLVLCHEDFVANMDLKDTLGHFSISDFRKLSCAVVSVSERLKKEARNVFRQEQMKAWRKENEKTFLKKKRAEEKENKKYAKPYLDYIDRQERLLFDEFWKKWRLFFLEYIFFQEPGNFLENDLQAYLKHFSVFKEQFEKEDGVKALQKVLVSLDSATVPLFLKSLKGFADLQYPLYGYYSGLSKERPLLAKHLASSFIKSASCGYLRSYAFRQSTIQGSIFKLVTAYAALKQRFCELKGKVSSADLCLFEIEDHSFHSNGRLFVGNFLDGKPIPQIYKGGRVPKSLRTNLGRMDLIKAIETSSNPYFALLAGDFLKDPEELALSARQFGYGEKSGIALPGEIAGNIPNDLKKNKTGLYATSIGQHTLVTTPLQTALMLSTFANGGKLLEPKIATLIAGKSMVLERNEVEEVPLSVRRQIFLPEPIRATIFEGMRRSAAKAQDDSQAKLLRRSSAHSSMHKDLVNLRGQFIGKTSTSEVIEKVGLDIGNPAHMYRHIWFGGISFKNDPLQVHPHSFVFSDQFGKPELVVVVYLRYGGYGKEAAPIAAAVIQKWRDILTKKGLN